MSDALEGHKASVSNGGPIFKTFRFADDNAFDAEEEEEAVDIVTSGGITCTRYKKEIALKLLFCSVCDTNNCHTYICKQNLSGSTLDYLDHLQ